MQEGSGFIREDQEALAGRMPLKTRENRAKQGNQHAHEKLQQLMYPFQEKWALTSSSQIFSLFSSMNKYAFSHFLI